MTQHNEALHWSAALLDGQGSAWLTITLLSLAGLVLGLAWLAGLNRRAGRAAEPVRGGNWLSRLHHDEAGTATVEFALAFPFIMFLGMVLLQSTLAMVGNMVVNYAAFTATRAAIVHIPADHGDPAEPRNIISPAEGSEKFDRIRAAAVFAVLPVAGRLDSSDYPGEEVRDGVDTLYSSSGRTAPNWVENFVAQRVHYAAENTTVTIMEAIVDGDSVTFDEITGATPYTLGPRDPVTVRVEHNLNLSVPYVRGIFADGSHTTATGPGAYTVVTAQYTLTNEGINPELPPLPQLPREP